MSRYAVIEAGVVVNHAASSAEFAFTRGWIPAGDSRIGDHYDPVTGYTHAPPSPEQLDSLRMALRERINAWRDAQEAATIVFEHAGRRWDGGLEVRTRLMPMLSLPALPHGFFWTDADDNDVPVDLPDLAALSAAHEAAIVAQGFAIHMRQRSMKAEIEALESADALAGYTPGWPIPPAN